jgi:hypothetical protein
LYHELMKELNEYKSKLADEEEERRQELERAQMEAHFAEQDRAKAAAAEERAQAAAAQERAKAAAGPAGKKEREEATRAAAASAGGEVFGDAVEAAKEAWNMHQPAGATEVPRLNIPERAAVPAGPQQEWKEPPKKQAEDRWQPAPPGGGYEAEAWLQGKVLSDEQKAAARAKLKKEQEAEFPFYEGHPFCMDYERYGIVPPAKTSERWINYFQQKHAELEDDYAPPLRFSWGLDVYSDDEPARPTKAEKKAAKRERKLKLLQNQSEVETTAAGPTGSSGTASSTADASGFWSRDEGGRAAAGSASASSAAAETFGRRPTVGPPPPPPAAATAAAASEWTSVGPSASPAASPAAASCSPAASVNQTPRNIAVKHPAQDLQQMWTDRQTKCENLKETLDRMRAEALELQLTSQDLLGVAEEMKKKVTLQRHYDDMKAECQQWEYFADVSRLQDFLEQKLDTLVELQKKDSCSASSSCITY